MFNRYEIFNAHLQNTDIQYADEYSEPGYTAKTGILIANWNDYEREGKIAEKLGYATEWSDEWTTCEDCLGLMRTQPDDMSWTRSYTIVENSEVCFKCISNNLNSYLPGFLEQFINNPKGTMPSVVEGGILEKHGFMRQDQEYVSGLRESDTDSSDRVYEQYVEKYDVLFTIDSKDMFSVYWAVWLRAKKSINVYYETITWGDTEDCNDYEEDRGEENTIDCVPDYWDADDNLTAVDLAVVALKDTVIEASSSHFHSGIWYIGDSDQDMRTGAHTTLSYHLHGFTEQEQEAVYRAVMAK